MDIMSTELREVQSRVRHSALLPLIAVFVFGVLLRNFVIANTDVSWLITFCEKILSGDRPYVDFIETNPPMAFLLYMLPVMFARAFAVRPEVVVDIFVFAGAALSLWLSATILVRAKLFTREAVFPLVVLFAAALVILPAQTFGQREHIATVLFLPLLALSVVRALNRTVPIWFVLAAGVGAGLVATIKPHFIAAIVLVAATAALSAKNWRTFFSLECWIAGAVFVGYAAAVYLMFPAFVAETLPLVAEIYVPIRMPLWPIDFATPIYLATLILVWLLKGRTALRAPYSLLVAASVGFSISYYAQSKGWAYHAYPMLFFALVAVVIAFMERWPLTADSKERNSAPRRILSALAISLVAGATFVWMNLALDMRALREPIARAVTNPKLLAITSDIGVGHPLTRALNGVWVGRVNALWATSFVKILKLQDTDPVRIRRYDELEKQDRAMLIEDIRRTKPDIILVDRIRYDWWKWVQADASLMREIENYKRLDEINDVLILRRK